MKLLLLLLAASCSLQAGALCAVMSPPLAGVTVRASNSRYTNQRVTEADGQVCFADIPGGSYDVSFTRRGYVPQTRRAEVYDDAATDLRASLRSAAVCVKTVDATGAVIMQATVTLSDRPTVTTNAMGSACFADVPPGSYSLKSDAIGFVSRERTVVVRPAQTEVDVEEYLPVGPYGCGWEDSTKKRQKSREKWRSAFNGDSARRRMSRASECFAAC